MKYKNIIFNVAAVLCCFFLILYIQHHIRGSYNNGIIQSLPSFLATIGAYFLFLLIKSNHKKALIAAFIINTIHELQRFYFEDIRVDIKDIIAIILALFILSYFGNYNIYSGRSMEK